MKLFKYGEFITESHLQLLLEANINFKKDFSSVLKKIDSPIAKKLIDVEGKEVDTNQNYIDIDKDKSDFLKFKSEDKVGKVAVIKNTSGYIPQISRILSKNPKSGIDSLTNHFIFNNYPLEGKTVQIIKEWTLNELIELLPEVEIANDFSSLVLIQWIEDGKKYQTTIIKTSLTIGEEAVKNSEVSVGRFIRALLTKAGVKFTDAEIEDFVYKYRAEIEKMKDALNKRFRVVKGDDIKKYYSVNKYEAESGDLGNSCMRYSRCQSYFDIYTDNSQVSLLLLMSEKEENQIAGRAILWEMEPYEISTKVMDRIYTIRTADQQLFKDWAIENEYWYKQKQDFSEYTPFEFVDKKTGKKQERQGEFSVKLDKSTDYSEYPYMDSFKYYDVSKGTLYNSSNFDHDYELVDTEGGNGSCSECGGRGRVECSRCDGDGTDECDECNGRGKVECDDCSGAGEVECHICDGEGTDKCSSCGGSGKDECEDCDGSGKEECEDCGGSGEIDGDECDSCLGNGKHECSSCGGEGGKECSDCDGEGRSECNRCKGDGTIKCNNCDGDGDLECDDCDGSGERECPRCDGEGREDCSDC
jgi:hypothetical protein